MTYGYPGCYGNGYGYGYGAGGAVPLLLDTVTGAAAAWSLRKLRTAYTGSAIRVRRSSDSAEQDIGFVAGALDTASLLSFVGAGDGFVATWYDQSGNAKDCTQATAGNQPRIVSSGTVDTGSHGLPVIYSVGTGTQRLIIPDVQSAVSDCWWSGVVQACNTSSNWQAITNGFLTAWGHNQLQRIWNGTATTWGMDNNSGGSSTVRAVVLNETVLISHRARKVSPFSEMWINGASAAFVATPPPSVHQATALIGTGATSGTQAFGDDEVKWSECVAWNTDKTADRTTIEAEMATFYGITLP